MNKFLLISLVFLGFCIAVKYIFRTYFAEKRRSLREMLNSSADGDHTNKENN